MSQDTTWPKTILKLPHFGWLASEPPDCFWRNGVVRALRDHRLQPIVRCRHANFSVHNFEQQTHSSRVVKTFNNAKTIREGTSDKPHCFALCYAGRKLYFPRRIACCDKRFHDTRWDRCRRGSGWNLKVA